MDLVDYIFPVMATIGVFLGSWLRPTSTPKAVTHIVGDNPINVVPSPTPKKSKAYTLGYTFQKEMLESDIKDTKISTYIEERTNPQGRYKNAKEFAEYESDCKKYFGEYGSWQGFKEKGTPEDVDEFNEGRHDATSEYYRAKANDMAFEQSLERSDDSVASLEKGLQEVYQMHHHSLDAHEVFERALERAEPTDK